MTPSRTSRSKSDARGADVFGAVGIFPEAAVERVEQEQRERGDHDLRYGQGHPHPVYAPSFGQGEHEHEDDRHFAVHDCIGGSVAVHRIKIGRRDFADRRKQRAARKERQNARGLRGGEFACAEHFGDEIAAEEERDKQHRGDNQRGDVSVVAQFFCRRTTMRSPFCIPMSFMLSPNVRSINNSPLPNRSFGKV